MGILFFLSLAVSTGGVNLALFLLTQLMLYSFYFFLFSPAFSPSLLASASPFTLSSLNQLLLQREERERERQMPLSILSRLAHQLFVYQLVILVFSKVLLWLLSLSESLSRSPVKGNICQPPLPLAQVKLNLLVNFVCPFSVLWSIFFHSLHPHHQSKFQIHLPINPLMCVSKGKIIRVGQLYSCN